MRSDHPSKSSLSERRPWPPPVSRYLFTPTTMHTALALIEKIIPDGIDDVPRDAWDVLAVRLKEEFDVTLHVHDHPPHGAFHMEPDVPIPHLLLVFSGETRDAIVAAINAHDDDLQAIAWSYDVTAATRDVIGHTLVISEDAMYAPVVQGSHDAGDMPQGVLT